MAFLFSYGTLQNKDVQLQLLGRTLDGEVDVLEGFQKKIVEQWEEKSFIIFRSEGCVTGLVLEIEEKELPILDEYETEYYTRSEVVLRSGKKAWVYHE